MLCPDPNALQSALAARLPPDVMSRCKAIAIAGPEWIRKLPRWRAGLAFRAYGRIIQNHVRDAEEANGGAAAEVYFTCLYEHQVRMYHAVIGGLRGRAWTGLYLHPHIFHRPDRLAPGVKRKWPISRLWSLPGLRGLLMLDEGIAPMVAQAIGRPVTLLPDIADDSCRTDDPLALSLQKFSAGRPIVGLLGHLVPSKGVVALARCALADSGSIVFAFAGEIHWEMFAEEEQDLLRRLKTDCPHVWIHDGRIPDESAYNMLFSSCDVIFAAYHDFPHSSNTLTKAAIFKKPVLVSSGHLIAERVIRYRLGEVLPAGCSEERILSILRDLVFRAEGWAEASKPDWAGYCRDHSPERLAEVLLGFFPRNQR